MVLSHARILHFLWLTCRFSRVSLETLRTTLKLRVSLTRFTSGRSRWCTGPEGRVGSAHLTGARSGPNLPSESLRLFTDRAVFLSSHTTLALAGRREIVSVWGLAHLAALRSDPRGPVRRDAGRLRSGVLESASPARRCAGLATVEDEIASPEASEDTTFREKLAVAG